MSKHFCIAKSINDLLACDTCGNICCNDCFAIKHIGQDKMIHPYKKLIDSDLYRNFLKLIHVEWLLGEKVLKSLGSFQVSEANKTYMVNCGFYGSQFYKQLFKDDSVAQQYLLLKCWYSNDPKSFDNLNGICKLLNESKSLDIISQYISKLTQPTEQEKLMSSHLDFYTGADISYLAQFIVAQQTNFDNYLKDALKNNRQFTIYQYIEERQRSDAQKNPTYYSNQFTAFLIQYYRKDSRSKEFFTLQDYVLNFWEYFSSTVFVNPTLKQFLESQIAFYKQYEVLMTQQKMQITLLGFRLWKLNYGVSQELPYLKNHYFLHAFVNGFIQMQIERTYSFRTSEEKLQHSKQTYLDFIKYIKDYSVLIQQKNLTLKPQQKEILDFSKYAVYYNYRRKLEPFHGLIKASKDNIYDKQVAAKFFNFYYGKTGARISPKLYKEFFKKCEEQKKEKELKLLEQVDKLKKQLEKQEKEDFYEFVFINFVSYCRQEDIGISKENYTAFKKNVMENMDHDYLKLTEEKFKRGDFEKQVEEAVKEEEKTEVKEEEPTVEYTDKGVKVTIGMDRYENEILVDNIHEAEDDQQCPCCHDDYYNCENPECSLMGYCLNCGDI